MSTVAGPPVRAAVRGGGAPGDRARPGPALKTTPLTLPAGVSLGAGPAHGWGWVAVRVVPDPTRLRTPGWGWATDRPGRRWTVAGAPTVRHRTTIRTTLREWSSRYLLAEIAGTVAALSIALTVHALSGSLASAALAGSVAESIAFYTVVLRRMVPGLWAAQAGHLLPRRLLRTAAGTITEASDFVLAELADTLLIRPGLIYLAAGWIDSGVGWGLLIGKLLADVGFYAVVIPSYELRKRLMSR